MGFEKIHEHGNVAVLGAKGEDVSVVAPVPAAELIPIVIPACGKHGLLGRSAQSPNLPSTMTEASSDVCTYANSHII